MLTLKVTDRLSPSELQTCVKALKDAGIVCYPTETFYAIGADPQSEVAVERIYKLKGRDSAKELPLIAGNLEMIERICETTHPSFQLLTSKFWPGPLTLVLPAKKAGKSFAIRISSHPIARQICDTFAAPIISTSLNESGNEPLRNIQNVPNAFLEQIDIFVDAGTCDASAPSTIVSLLEKQPRMIRKGIIPEDQIFAAV